MFDMALTHLNTSLPKPLITQKASNTTYSGTLLGIIFQVREA